MRLFEGVIEPGADVTAKLVDLIVFVCVDLVVLTDVRRAICCVFSAAGSFNVKNWLVELGELDFFATVEAVSLAGSDLFVSVSGKHGVVAAPGSLACRAGLC